MLMLGAVPETIKLDCTAREIAFFEKVAVLAAIILVVTAAWNEPAVPDEI